MRKVMYLFLMVSSLVLLAFGCGNDQSNSQPSNEIKTTDVVEEVKNDPIRELPDMPGSTRTKCSVDAPKEPGFSRSVKVEYTTTEPDLNVSKYYMNSLKQNDWTLGNVEVRSDANGMKTIVRAGKQHEAEAVVEIEDSKGGKTVFTVERKEIRILQDH